MKKTRRTKEIRYGYIIAGIAMIAAGIVVIYVGVTGKHFPVPTLLLSLVPIAVALKDKS